MQQSEVVEVKGAVDGTVWTQVFDHDPHPLCSRNAESYLEIAEGYVGYLTALAAESDDFARMVVERQQRPTDHAR